MLTQFLIVALFGAIGAVSRFAVIEWLHAWAGGAFAYSTLVVNVIGSFLIGIAFALLVEKALLPPIWRIGFVIGFLGAFTTFSTFSLDTYRMLENGEFFTAAFNVSANVCVCVLMTWLGIKLAR